MNNLLQQYLDVYKAETEKYKNIHDSSYKEYLEIVNIARNEYHDCKTREYNLFNQFNEYQDCKTREYNLFNQFNETLYFLDKEVRTQRNNIRVRVIDIAKEKMIAIKNEAFTKYKNIVNHALENYEIKIKVALKEYQDSINV